MPMSETFLKVEMITGVARRRRYKTEQELAIVAETMQPGQSVSTVARRHGLACNFGKKVWWVMNASNLRPAD